MCSSRAPPRYSARSASGSRTCPSATSSLCLTRIPRRSARSPSGLLAAGARDLYAEGVDPGLCTARFRLTVERGDTESVIDLADPQDAAAHLRHSDRASLELALVAPLPHVTLGQADDIALSPARRTGTRPLRDGHGGHTEVPVYALLNQPPGAQASGPAVIEGPFFTMRVPAGWQFVTTAAGDLRLTDRGQPMSTVMRIPMTEYLEIDLGTERWLCRRCGHDFGSARGNYKEGTLVYDRDPREIHRPLIDPARYEFTFAPDPAWCRILEYYCPWLRNPDRDRIPAARPSADLRHADRRRRAQGAMGGTPARHGDPARPRRPRRAATCRWGEPGVKRISVDIGGTFTDCFVAWDGRYIQAKALTTHHNLARASTRRSIRPATPWACSATTC